jgi:hypothetical protein
MPLYGSSGYCSLSPSRNHFKGSFTFETNNASAPDGVVDPGGIIAANGTAHTSQGKLTFTLDREWRYVHAVANYTESGAFVAQVAGVTQGRGTTATIIVEERALDGSGTLTNSTDKTITVSYDLYM